MSDISSALKVSTNTARWHLRKLMGGGLVFMKGNGGRTLYYPFDFVSIEHIPIFEFLSENRMRNLYVHLVDHPGSTQSDLATSMGMSNQATIRATKRMEYLGLVSRIQDGVYARYFPTDLLVKLKEDNSSRMKTFQDNILKRLDREGLKPKIIRRESGHILVEFVSGSDKSVLDVSTDPFSTALAD